MGEDKGCFRYGKMAENLTLAALFIIKFSGGGPAEGGILVEMQNKIFGWWSRRGRDLVEMQNKIFVWWSRRGRELVEMQNKIFGWWSRRGRVVEMQNKIFGWWRSPVAHLYGVQVVAGSNPVHPTL